MKIISSKFTIRFSFPYQRSIIALKTQRNTDFQKDIVKVSVMRLSAFYNCLDTVVLQFYRMP